VGTGRAPPRRAWRGLRRPISAAVRCGSPEGRGREGRRWTGGRRVAGGGARELAGGRVDTSMG
jgi:hypothetical protein